MTARFDQHGICFQYPASWAAHVDAQPDRQLQITVDAPGTAFWSLHVFPERNDTEALLETLMSSLREQYDSLESESRRESIAGRPTNGYDAYFYCLDFLVAATIRVIPVEEGTWVTLAQAENREFEQMESVFRAITTSLLQETGCKNYKNEVVVPGQAGGTHPGV